MTTPEEKLIDAIGGVSDKNVMLAVGEEPDLETNVRRVEFTETEAPAKSEIKRYRVRNAVIGGAAAAVALTGGLFVWNNIRDTVIPPEPAQSTTDTAFVQSPVNDYAVVPGLRWGMSVDEVKAVQGDDCIMGEVERGINLIYDNARIMNRDASLELTVSDRRGLDEIYYDIPTDDVPGLFAEVREYMRAQYGDIVEEYLDNDPQTAICIMRDRELTVFAMATDKSVQLTYWRFSPGDEGYYDVRNLWWGMTVDEVKAHETAPLSEEILPDEEVFEQYRTTELIYENVEFEGYNTRMEISVSVPYGLQGVNYYISADDCEALYEKICAELTEKYGEKSEPRYGYDWECSIWEFPTYMIYVQPHHADIDSLDGEVQYGIWDITDHSDEEYVSENDQDGIIGDYRMSSDSVRYTGDREIENTDFGVFENYFAGRWTASDDSGQEIILDYNDDTSFPYHYCYMIDCFEVSEGIIDGDEYLVIHTRLHGETILRVPIAQPDTLYEYLDTDEVTKHKDEYDHVYTKSGFEGGSKLGIFGIARYENGLVRTEGGKTDLNADCEKILLDCADKLSELVKGYCSYDRDSLAFTLGEESPKLDLSADGTYKVVADDVHTYSDVRGKFSDYIYGDYIDYITANTLIDSDGELYFIDPISGYLGTYETWYLGCEVTENSIIGHFAELQWGDGDDELQDIGFLNNEEHYRFYDITVKNVDGRYVITDCRYTGDERYQCPLVHGLFYEKDTPEMQLVTNGKLKPRAASAAGGVTDGNAELQRFIYDFSRFWNSYICCWGLEYSMDDTVTINLYRDDLGIENDETFYRVTDPLFDDMAGMKAAMSEYMTDKMIEFLQPKIDYNFREIDGKLYKAAYAGDDWMIHGFDYVYIRSAEYADDGSVTVTMCAHGDAENWDLTSDNDVEFTIKLVRTASGYKVDEYDDGDNAYLARFYTISSRDQF